MWGLDLSGSLEGAGGIGGLLAMTTASGDAYFYAYDGNGDVVQLVESTGAGVEAEYLYEAFGRVLAATGPAADENPMRFSTKQFCAASELVDYGFRSMRPEIGAWLSRDPLGIDAGANEYGLLGNSPPNAIDPHGLDYFFDTYVYYEMFGPPPHHHEDPEGTIGNKLYRRWLARATRGPLTPGLIANIVTERTVSVISDDLDEMVEVEDQIDEALLLFLNGRLLEGRQRVCLVLNGVDLNESKYSLGGIGFPDYGRQPIWNSTGWWLGGAHHVYAQGEVCFCRNKWRRPAIESTQLALEWHDRVDARASFKTDPWQKAVFEYAYTPYERLFHVGFPFVIHWRYDRP